MSAARRSISVDVWSALFVFRPMSVGFRLSLVDSVDFRSSSVDLSRFSVDVDGFSWAKSVDFRFSSIDFLSISVGCRLHSVDIA